MAEDVALQALVIDELSSDPCIDALNIGVLASNGSITLTGFVNSFAAKTAAAAAAERVRGVRAVIQELEVRVPRGLSNCDDDIAAAASRVLAADVEISPQPIRVTVSHGTVTLSGHVGWHFQRVAAERAIGRLPGVRNVINLLVLGPQDIPAPPAEAIRARIEQSLDRLADIEPGSVHVNVAGTQATLVGRVRSCSVRRAAIQAAWSASGVAAVRDQLTVRA